MNDWALGYWRQISLTLKGESIMIASPVYLFEKLLIVLLGCLFVSLPSWAQETSSSSPVTEESPVSISVNYGEDGSIGELYYLGEDITVSTEEDGKLTLIPRLEGPPPMRPVPYPGPVGWYQTLFSKTQMTFFYYNGRKVPVGGGGILPCGDPANPPFLIQFEHDGTITANYGYGTWVAPFLGAIGYTNYYFCGSPTFILRDPNGFAGSYSATFFQGNTKKTTTVKFPPPPPPPPPPGPTRQYTGQWLYDQDYQGLTVLMNFASDPRYIFVPWYTYDASGKASWYLFQGNNWAANDKITERVCRYSGPAWGIMPYDNSKTACTDVGTATLTFTSDTAATLSYSVEGSSRTVALSRFESTSSTPLQYSGQWAAQGENAWGLTVLMNFYSNTSYIFVPWYTYDASGKASWYIFQGGTWSSINTISMDVYRYVGSPWGAPYDSNAFSYVNVGTAMLEFTSDTAAIFSYNVEGANRTITLYKLQ